MKSAVTYSLATLLLVPAAGCGQERRSAERRSPASSAHPTSDRRRVDDFDGKQADSNSPRRLESVTWNSVSHELTWVISKGQKKEGASYKTLGSENYLIKMDDATMSFSGETRRFSKEEAANVHVLMDLVSKYAVDSTVWWDDGQGEPVNGNEKDRRTPQKQRNRERDDNLPTLHVSWRNTGQPSGTWSVTQMEIQRLEKRVAQLKRLHAAEATSRLRLAHYTPDQY
jgi:hypothetical protein